MTRTRRRCAATVLITVMAAGLISGCGWRGVNSLPLPGTEGNGPGSFTVQAEMPDVSNLQSNSRVRVADVTVGHVTNIQLQHGHALVTMRVAGDVDLPANATAKMGMTTIFGSLHIELAPPTDQPPQGRLRDGSVIPLARAGAYPTPEQTLAALSLVLNGGGVGQAGDITAALSTAFRGREHDLRSLIGQLDTFAGNLNDQSGEIIAASDSLNNLLGKFAAQQPVLDRAVQTIPNALGILNDERSNLVETADNLGKFSALTADMINRTKTNLTKELHDVGPVLAALGDAGPSVVQSLGLIPTYPFPNGTVEKWQRGDYANLTAVIDLTLSRIDAGLFTGTRWECDLTELELQWGRTIGQYPSPCMAGGPFNKGNPLTAPYHYDQGR
ncbi:MAG: virulence factor Mce family protein [Actinomycetota bacterium]|uniref:Virulence factor Mce family protein n=1 Tax=Mycobacterium lentiflavum TaxID=141349 RepID=A0ABY3UT85_MYCLN|nr:virulence factor Mce family protein [Mycobacterium lentiflavum]MEE3062429.1 virulence factor Mce family protein [Actinomycetota bacterium]ULP40346.1 virulence factor Mce family protein [Mycobacterium lentiflavum]